MRYVDLGNAPSRARRTQRNRKTRAVKFIVWTLALFFTGYLAYSFKPIAEQGLKMFLAGPSTVLSFLRQDSTRLDQTDGRTNFLLLGIDKRSYVPYTYAGSGGVTQKNGFLSDTMIVGSFNQKDGTMVLFSIPRDLWVEIPAFNGLSKQYSKINAAYSIGNLEDYPGGGLEISKKVISSVMGIPIHYAFRIDFEGFQKLIDLVGGIDVSVENAFDDYAYPREGYEDAPNESDRYLYVHFDAGLQHMDGQTALEFVRSRHALGPEGSDYARSERQQKVILAVKDKALSLTWISSPSQLKNIYTTLGETMETDVPLSDLPLFLPLAKKVDTDSVQNYLLGSLSQDGNEEELFYNPPEDQFGGGWVLVPKSGDWSEVHSFIQKKLFGESKTSQNN